MIDAKLLVTHDGTDGSAVEVYGVWIPRKGDNVRFTTEVVKNYGTDFTVEVFQKNYEDAGDGATTATSSTWNAVEGRQTMELLGCKEVVRLRVSLNRHGDLPSADIGHVLFRFLQPVWFEAVEA